MDEPTDRWLRAAVAVAETGSFTAAAERMGVSQSAISHTVSRLEAAVGVPLFDRDRSGARPTAAGEQLVEELRRGYQGVDAAVAAVRRLAELPAPLTISISTSLATYWMMGRLGDFKASHPELDLRCVTTDNDLLVGSDGADLWIPLGRGPWPGLEATEFCDELIYPVAAPDLAASIDSVDSLGDAPLLQLEERYTKRFDWEQWFVATGAAAPTRPPSMTSPDYSLILYAALAGQGVALGWHHIVVELVASGDLVRLGDRQVTTDYPFLILSRPDGPVHPGLPAFRQWLIDQ